MCGFFLSFHHLLQQLLIFYVWPLIFHSRQALTSSKVHSFNKSCASIFYLFTNAALSCFLFLNFLEYAEMIEIQSFHP